MFLTKRERARLQILIALIKTEPWKYNNKLPLRKQNDYTRAFFENSVNFYEKIIFKTNRSKRS